MNNTIEAKADSVLLSIYGDIDKISLPIDLSKILEKNNIKTKEGIFADPDILGAYYKKDGERMIVLSEKDPYQEKIFTVAHELGHYFLQSDTNRDIFFRTQITQLDKEKKPEELEANLFAVSLLMPEKLLLKYWKLSHEIDVLAKIFGVTPAVTAFRLKTLNLI